MVTCKIGETTGFLSAYYSNRASSVQRFLTHRRSELKHVRVRLSPSSRRYISALSQRDGPLPHGCYLKAFVVKVLQSHDAFDGSAVQHKPTLVPFLKTSNLG